MSFFHSFLYCCFVLITTTCWGDLPSETLYLTWKRDPTTTMTIQWLSLAQDQSHFLEFKKDEQEDWQSTYSQSLKFPHDSTYRIHQVELIHLEPFTYYTFRLKDSDQVYYFRTMPTEIDQTHSIRFIAGGDMYHDHIEFTKETSKQAARTNPDFALVGGDIAYAIHRFHPQKIQNWIEWIKAWHECMVAPDGRLIPVIAAVGNHDVIGQYDQTPEQAQIFSTLFPMPGNQVYNTLDFGNYLSLFILDSGHANPIAGIQKKWLNQALQQRRHIPYKFAIYHIPAYPSVRPLQTKNSRLIREHWVPLFEKGGVNLVFENHDHAYKRTHPLLNNRINARGIIYVGDGAWGIEKPRYPRISPKKFYLAKAAPERHFLVINLKHQHQSVMSINSMGQLLDQFSFPISSTIRSNQTQPENSPSNLVKK